MHPKVYSATRQPIERRLISNRVVCLKTTDKEGSQLIHSPERWIEDTERFRKPSVPKQVVGLVEFTWDIDISALTTDGNQ